MNTDTGNNLVDLSLHLLCMLLKKSELQNVTSSYDFIQIASRNEKTTEMEKRSFWIGRREGMGIGQAAGRSSSVVTEWFRILTVVVVTQEINMVDTE